MGANVPTAAPAVAGVIESRTALLLRGDSASVSPCPDQPRGWRAGYRRTSIERLLTRVAQRLLDKARQGSEAVARLRRRVLGVGEVSGAMLGAWGHPTWMRRQSNPRATRRSWENPTCGAMTRSPLTEMKEDHAPAVTCVRMSRELRGHHLPPCSDGQSNSPNECPVGTRSPQVICPVRNAWPRARGVPSPFTQQ